MAKSYDNWMKHQAVTVDGKTPFAAKEMPSKFTYTNGGPGVESAGGQMQRPNIPGINYNKPIIFEPPSMFQGGGASAQFQPQMGGFGSPMDMRQLHQQCQAQPMQFPQPFMQQPQPVSIGQNLPPAYIMPPQGGNFMPPSAGSPMQAPFMGQSQMPFSVPPGASFNWM